MNSEISLHNTDYACHRNLCYIYYTSECRGNNVIIHTLNKTIMIARANLSTGVVHIRIDNINSKHKTYEGECIYSTCFLNIVGDYAKNWDANVFETEADYWDGDNSHSE